MDLETDSGGRENSSENDNNLLTTLHNKDYHGTVIPAVEDWLDSQNLGSKSSSEFDEIDAFLSSIADRTPTQSEILHSSAGWGVVEELLRGKSLASGTIFPVDEESLKADMDVAPWYDLVSTGTFSQKSLNRHAISFQISPIWVKAIEHSAAAFGFTWLHHFHLGVVRAVRGDGLFRH